MLMNKKMKLIFTLLFLMQVFYFVYKVISNNFTLKVKHLHKKGSANINF